LNLLYEWGSYLDLKMSSSLKWLK